MGMGLCPRRASRAWEPRYNIKVTRLRTIEEQSPKLQECSFSLSHLSDQTYDQNNEKPRREGQTRFP